MNQNSQGLVGLRAGYGSEGRGEVITIPFVFKAGATMLVLNLDTGSGGEVRVEVQDASAPAGGGGGGGQPAFPGYTLYDSIPLTRNALAVKVAWAGDHARGTNVSAFAGVPIQLRFVMEDAWLFSFAFE